ncbi:type VI secretion system membrane subunit TssM [Rhizobium leguminosarum]|uniref:type VI secretion system membrane subunit TssM n=1 Tax=Rhizobium leguminosarum TaxID=384 RepID=UPI00103F34C1|nr:type VI secretion system membrane subunit TssM [Rhizobium leguminosarum]TBY18101.1 type VI secretion system membrane subunit TssM [Rhizobium leguminosarum bv. viciae]TBY25999.1 type VI secretion system membrane subunit TssM [Rhizobium leguminosarum bv. viciae]TBZ04615.1 type VI secretion system membrane subunit TssM [Rhizobium leguminosarum bv. viciae]
MNPLSYFYTLRSYVEAYAGLIGRRFISIIWVAAICVVIWFYGYLAAYGDFKPLASTSARLTLIGIILAAWLAYLVFTTIRDRRRDKQLVEGIERDAEAEAAASQQAEVGEIHGRLKEALQLLRRITKKRFGYIYELPWYVIFGAPGSGKTTALSNSGLKFPLGDALGSNSVQGIGGTRNCNWWFTDEAILIDTAGRYTTQDDLDGTAKAGWEGFLGLLRKYRRSQPINGALVTLSIGDLLTRDPEAQREEIRAIRQRLSELDELLHARVPVYLLLTKADLLTGFVEFFDGFNKSDREQVWGTTFGLDESYKAANLPERFMEEFTLLQQRVDTMLIERLQQEPNPELRGRIFRFPAELTALKERLHEVVTELCSGSKLVEAPLLRGIYFASGTQREETVAVPRMRRSYFLSRLFKEVIFGEASLVARDKRLSGRQLLFRRAAYAATVLLLAVVLTSWTATYIQNTTALAGAERRIDAYEQLVRGVPVRDVSDADFLRILPALDNLAAVTTDFSKTCVWPISLGLDQEGKVASRQREAYQRALNALLLPRMLVQLQKEMTETTDVTRTFDALKLYGMLGGLGPVNADFASLEAEDMFTRLYPDEGRAAARQALIAHADVMARGALPPIELDKALIAKAREVIRSENIANRAYDILAEYRESRALPAWSPAGALGPLGEQAFERKSKAPLNEGIAGLFSATGYRTIVLPGITDAAREALDEQWVRGDPSPAGVTVDTIAQATLQLYFDAFEQRWSTMLTDIRVKPSQTIADAAETTRILASKPSPVETITKSIVAATDLRAPGAEIASAAGDSLPTSTTALASAANAPDPFGRLREALKAPVGQSSPADQPKDAPRSEIGQLEPILQRVQEQLSRATTSTAEVAKVFDVDSQLTDANQDLLQQARKLPAPVDTWMAGLAADVGSLAVKSARSRISDAWAAEGAGFCSNVVAGRYPFDRKSPRDVAMSDFIRLFGPEGLFKTFFKEKLEAFVDTSASPWGWKGTFGAASIPSAAIAQFENADKINRAFFPAGSENPSISINVKPVSLTEAASAVMLEIEGERVVYFHGPIQSKSITWPSTDASNVSRLAFQPGGWQQALTENGDWSPFRLFDDANLAIQGDDLFRAKFQQNGQAAEFDVQFGSVLNPFRLEALGAFACPAQF